MPDDTIGMCAQVPLTHNVLTGTPDIYLWSPLSEGVLNETDSVATLNPVGITDGPHAYFIEVTDVYTCTSVDTVVITIDSLSVETRTDTVIGECNVIELSSFVLDGSPDSYSWDNSVGLSDTAILSPDFTALGHTGNNVYNLTVKDIYGCSDTASVGVRVYPLPTAVTIADTAVGLCDNSTRLSTNTSGVNLRFQWTEQPNRGMLDAYNIKSPVIINPIVGSYTYVIEVSDDYSCTALDTVLVTVDTLPQMSFVVSDVSCNGFADGSIDMLMNPSGASPFTYNWSFVGVKPGYTFDLSDAAIQDPDSLHAGTYYVTVTDRHGCSSEDNTFVNEPQSLIVTDLVNTESRCFGENHGEISLTIDGGTLNYFVEWTGTTPYGTYPGSNSFETAMPATGVGIANIYRGDYKISIEDGNGCLYDTTISVGERPEMIFDFVLDSVKCAGNSDGELTLNVSGGTPGFTFNWEASTSGTVYAGQTISNLSGDMYYVTVTDANVCQKFGDTVLYEPAPMELTISDIVPADCYELPGGGGYVSFSISGGNDYWIDPISGLTYEAMYEDLTNDRQTSYEPTSYMSVSSNSYAGDSVRISVRDLRYGATEANCAVSTVIFVPQPEEFRITVNPDDIILPWCYKTSDGEIYLGTEGGNSGLIDWTWEDAPRINSHYRDNLPAGTYTVIAMDSKGCSDTSDIPLPNQRDQCITIPNAFSPNTDGVHDVWEIKKLSELYPNCQIEVYNRWGQMVWKSDKGYTEPWDGTKNGYPLPVDSYHYIIQYNDGVEKPEVGQVTILK
jgi:gliding motility-associated-like protein